MFKFLKEKISNWTKKVSEEVSKEESIDLEKETSEQIKKKEISNKKVTDSKEKSKEEIPEKKEEKPKEKNLFSKIKSSISLIKIEEEKFSDYAEDLTMILLENNVAFEVAEKIIEELKIRIVGKEIEKNKIEEEIKDNLKEIIEDILVEGEDIEKEISLSKEPYVILFCGINGTGKTTTIAKLAYRLNKQGISCVMAAADTFRAASIEQIKIHGEKLGIEVISHEYNSDPASVGFDAIKYAKKNNIKCVLIDTAGRMYTEKNLMREITKISKVCNPNKKIFVGESITGNDSIEQIKAFNEEIGIDGIILSKSDIDEKGGTALSLGYITKKPIIYLGNGQEYSNLEKFNKKSFVEKIGI